MAHKALIGGTAYEIKGGRDLIDGTGYDKKQGKTLVNGTGYDISFRGGPKWVIKSSPSYGGKEIDEAISFVSNGTTYSRIRIYYYNTLRIGYGINAVQLTTVYSYKKWESDEFRTLEFNEEPTGALLTWLKSNAVQK